MKSYTEQDVRAAIAVCGIAVGDTVLVHSSLMHLGRMKGVAAAELAARHYRLLREAIGPDGTIVVPTFTFVFCRGEPYDPHSSPSVGMGVLSEYVRRLPGVRRSPHPMQSVAAVGPRAAAICAVETRSTFDEGGPFATMVELDARGLLLGAPMQSFSLVHLAEERCAVPYRYWKEFTAPYGDPPRPRTFAMYVRDLDQDRRLDLSRIESALAAEGLLRQADLGAGQIKAFALADFLRVTMRGLQASPSWLR